MAKSKGKNKGGKKTKKKVKLGVCIPPPTKSSRRSISPSDFNNMCPSWRFRKIDMYGKWGWENITLSELKDLVLPRLKDLETMRWLDFVRDTPGYSHSIPVDRIDRDARKRLTEIHQDDVDELFSLVISGERRVWGIKSGYVLNILWWDPHHEVYPVSKS